MRKSLFICVLAILLCLSACSAPAADNPDATETKPTVSSAPDTKPTEPTKSEALEFEPGYFPIPEEPATFSFLSGADGWRTDMDINCDGTFSGRYQHEDIDASGDGYRNTCYVCDFSGVFADVEKVNQYTYKVRLTDLDILEPVGKEWIDKEIRYIAAEPYGLKDPEGKQECEEFIVYMPTAPISELPEEFLTWWPYQGQQKTTLSCYGLLNVATNAGFFYTPEA